MKTTSIAAVALAAVAVALHVTAAAAGAPFAHARLALADGTRIGTVRFWDDRRHGATVVKVKLAVPSTTWLAIASS